MPAVNTEKKKKRPGNGDGSKGPARTEYRRVTFEEIRKDAEVLAMIEGADQALSAIGFTDHGIRHIARVAARAMKICRDLKLAERDRQLAGIAAYLHDTGNAVHRNGHAQSSALIAWELLRRKNMDPSEVAVVMAAIGNHDEGVGEAVNNPGAALILADKSDVLRQRVRSATPMLTRDIHDRVNYAATDSKLHVDREGHLITLDLSIDTNVSPVMEYFEIFLGRMAMCRRAANFLNCDFSLLINQTRLL